jgi:hypothetical protein
MLRFVCRRLDMLSSSIPYEESSLSKTPSMLLSALDAHTSARAMSFQIKGEHPQAAEMQEWMVRSESCNSAPASSCDGYDRARLQRIRCVHSSASLRDDSCSLVFLPLPYLMHFASSAPRDA